MNAPDRGVNWLLSSCVTALDGGTTDTLLPTDGATRTATVINSPTWMFGMTVLTEDAVGVTADLAAVVTSMGRLFGSRKYWAWCGGGEQ